MLISESLMKTVFLDWAYHGFYQPNQQNNVDFSLQMAHQHNKMPKMVFRYLRFQDSGIQENVIVTITYNGRIIA